jgi:aspartyl-tRNA(Asn)/glutamyl-tRNA(Gln) amidotransferase subunit A
MLEKVLKRVERNEYNAYITVVNIGNNSNNGELKGIPIVIKDIIYTKNIRTTAGSKILKDFIPTYDATIVSKLLNAGAIIVAKTNTHEFAMGATNTSSYFGPVRNPHDIERISGGSSGGSAAAVAAGDVPVAIGTDTGGSVRIPAAFCGVIGFKPTFGRISRHGVIPMSWSLDHVGIIGKDISIIRKVYNVLKGYDPKDPSTVVNLQNNIKKRGVKKIGVIKELTENVLTEDSFWKFLSKISSKYDIQEISVPFLRETAKLRLLIASVEAAAYHMRFLDQHESDYFPDVLSFIKAGLSISGIDYVNALRLRTELSNKFLSIFKEFDILASPTVEEYPPKISEVLGREFEWRVKLTRNTAPFNFFSVPAISISADKFVGVQFVANIGYDDYLLDFVEELSPKTYIKDPLF